MREEIKIPNEWAPRPYQLPTVAALEAGKRRFCLVEHRRAGKDSTALNVTAMETQKVVGVYWHLLPTSVQARKVIWDNIDGQGRRMIDQAFPPAIRTGTNSSEMKITLKNGSLWQLAGSDNYNSLVGGNVRGVIFSEWALCDPVAWEYIRPILVENKGWAMFLYTPRGRNHGKRTYDIALKNPATWHCELLTVEDTVREDGVTPVVSLADIEQERNEGMSDEKIQQEFYCSFTGGLEGAYYTKLLEQARVEQRIGHFPWNPNLPVHTYWDIGHRDNTAIIFAQKHPSGIPILIDYLTNRNQPLAWYVQELHAKPYLYATYNGPHDLEQIDWATDKTATEVASRLGIDFNIVANIPRSQGIDAAKQLLRRCLVDEEKCAMLLDSLYAYRRTWDEKRAIFTDEPYHDWSSHGADAMRYLAVDWDDRPTVEVGRSRYHNVRRALG